MGSELRKFLAEPGPSRPPGVAPWDRRFALGFAGVMVAEGLLRESLALRPLQIAVGLGILGTLLLRRPRPLLALVLGFGLTTAFPFALRAFGLPDATLHANACVLLLGYSLLRWGSGRDVVAGAVVLVLVYASSALRGEMHGAAEAVGAAVVMLFPGALGASARFRAEAHARELDQVKLRERAELARDLHDTVAHHVAAIAIQAQAGRAVLAQKPEATAGALAAIEKEASRTLAELRAMVGSLREDRAASLAPQPTLPDLARLAEGAGGLAVDVELGDGLSGIRPAAQTALFRIAQEAVTNALRHAKGATRARVRVAAEGEVVRMTVDDDGALPARRGSGFGLVGMAERAALLGGKLEAGPREGGGWKVEVVLPFEGESR